MDKKNDADGCNSKKTLEVTSASRKKKKACMPEIVKEPSDLPPLPKEWKVYKSKHRPDKIYYFNEKTGKACWRRPNTASEDSSGSSKTSSSSAQKELKQKQNKIAKRPEKKQQNKPEVVILYEKRAVENQEHPSKTTADDRSSSKSRKRQGTTLVAPDSSSKKSKPEQRAKTPSLPDMEVTSTASTSSDNAAYNTFGEFNHGASLNEGMTLNRWLDSHKIDAQPESMDWETSTSFPGNVCQETAWHIVVDTNVLLHHLEFVYRLRDANCGEFGIAIVVIPWAVLQELDHFKSNNSKKPHLQPLARSAISFIHCSLTSKHPRLIGQFRHAKRNNVINDDEILLHCLELRSQDKKVMLLTEDKNLCNKAVVANVECQSVASLRQWVSLESPSSPKSTSNRKQQCDVAIIAQHAGPCYDVVNSGKSVMVTFFGHLLTKEMQNKFGELWMRIVLKKPPWHFKDLMLCLEKHWIAAVSDAFARPAEQIIKSILKLPVFDVQKSWRAMNKDDVTQALDLCISLCHNVTCSKYNIRRDTAVEELQALKQRLVASPKPSPKREPTAPISNELSTKEKDDEMEVPENLDRVVSYFNDLWNNVNAYCCEVSTMIWQQDITLINRIQTTIMSYFRFFKAFLQINDRLIIALVVSDSDCNINDLTEMQSLLLNNPTIEGGGPDIAPFSLMALKNFYISKRSELLQAREGFRQSSEVIVSGLNFLMAFSRQT